MLLALPIIKSVVKYGLGAISEIDIAGVLLQIVGSIPSAIT